jgi:hypothetical protein
MSMRREGAILFSRVIIIPWAASVITVDKNLFLLSETVLTVLSMGARDVTMGKNARMESAWRPVVL